MMQQTEPNQLPGSASGANQGLELRHLRYLVAVADAGTFTHAAERIFISQPTLSQQIRRLEEMVGTPLLQRCREGVRLTAAGRVLLEESRTVLSQLEHGITHARRAAGLGRSRLRFVLPPDLPEALAVQAASRLRSAAAAAGVDVVWVESPLDGEFSLIGQRRVDAGLGWLTPDGDAVRDRLEVMSLGEFEPELWIPAAAGLGHRGTIGLDDLAGLQVIHGPRPASAGTYDAWLTVLRARQPRFAFTDPPFLHSLPMTLAFAATASRPTAVLTGPRHRVGGPATPIPLPRAADTYDMVRAGLQRHPLTATAALVWSGDLPRQLQQILFDIADSITQYELTVVAS